MWVTCLVCVCACVWVHSSSGGRDVGSNPGTRDVPVRRERLCHYLLTNDLRSVTDSESPTRDGTAVEESRTRS